jgi:predicted nucleic-acid-binding Zn-ribbon protein
MRCIACGATMRLEQVVPTKVMRAQGYEYRSFKCSRCPWTERRLAFTPQDASSSDEPPSSRTVPRSVEAPSKDTLARLRTWSRAMGTLRSRQERRS